MSEMPDTYMNFVLGYGIFVVLLFGMTVFLLARTLKLEKEIAQLKSADTK